MVPCITHHSRGIAQRLVWYFHDFPEENVWDLAKKLSVVPILKSRSSFVTRLTNGLDRKELA